MALARELSQERGGLEAMWKLTSWRVVRESDAESCPPRLDVFEIHAPERGQGRGGVQGRLH